MPEYTVNKVAIPKILKPIMLVIEYKPASTDAPTSKTIMPISWKKVLIFPDLSAARTNPREAATILKPLTISSLAKITATAIAPYHGIIAKPKGHNIIINAVETKHLSAIGSKNLPRFVTKLYFLAI